MLKSKLSKDKVLWANLFNIEVAVQEVHKDRILLPFSEHNHEHSKRMIFAIENLCPTLTRGKQGLNIYETFILLASFYLHDIGMQINNHNVLKDFSKQYNLIYEQSSIEDFVRNNHHLLSEYWIISNIKDKKCKLRQVYFGNKELGLIISQVVKSHGIDFLSDNEYINKSYKGQIIRLPLICSLLSLCDVLDCDCRRIDYERLSNVDIPIVSKIHWMKHYYVSSIEIHENIIKIYYVFPKLTTEKLSTYKYYFSYCTKFWIKYCKEKYFDIYKTIGINYTIIEDFDVSDIKDELSEEELEQISDELVEICSNSSEHGLINRSFEISIGIVKYNNCVLMVKRRTPEDELQWQFPAGIIKPKNTAAEIAVSEVYNETGINTRIISKLGRRIFTSTGVVCHYYALEYISGEVYNKDEVENCAADWVSLNDYQTIITSELFSKVRKYLNNEEL